MLSRYKVSDTGGAGIAFHCEGETPKRSSRILLTHLTDVQGESARYADASRKILLQWGRGCLVEAGAAEVELRIQPLKREARLSPQGGDLSGEAALNGVDGFTVYALDTAGNRTGENPSTLENGTLRFRVSTACPNGGRMYYEIVCDPTR